MSDERAFPLDVRVKEREFVPVALSGEAGHGPDDLAQEVDDRSDVVERQAERLAAQIVDDQPGGLRFPPCSFYTSPFADGLATHHELRQFPVASRSDLLRQVDPSGLKDPCYLIPLHHCGMAADDEIEGPIGEG